MWQRITAVLQFYLQWKLQLTSVDLHSLSLLRFCVRGRSSLMCGLWQMKRNSNLCLRSARRATCFSNGAKLRKPQRSTTMALPASKIYRWRLGHSWEKRSDPVFLVSIFFSVNTSICNKMHSLTPCDFCLRFQEHPGDEAWMKLDHMITPLLLNYCQCKLLQGQYYEVIEHCTSVVFKYESEALLLVLYKNQQRLNTFVASI